MADGEVLVRTNSLDGSSHAYSAGTVLILPAVGALIIKLILPRRKLLISGRAILFLMATLALGPGLLVNVLLKDHWGRPRPVDVTQFGGDQHFVAWWDPRGECPNNCSFVSGDVAAAFWTLAETERDHIVEALRNSRGVISGAAARLGCGRREPRCRSPS